jgi:uncharacterized protein
VARDADRIHTLDILRGFALFGMVWVHFHQEMRLDVTGWQDWVGWFVYIFVEQKAWGTFALLFGVGFAVLLRRLDARGEPVVPIYLRRMAALAVIGILMDVFLGFQVLFTYACGGVLLLLVRRWSTRALLALAVFSAMARPVAVVVTALVAKMSQTPRPPNPLMALTQAVEAASHQSSYWHLVAARWHVFTAPFSWRVLLPDVNLALFIVGLLAVRYGIFDAPLKHVRMIRGWMIFGFVSWAFCWAVVTQLPDPSFPALWFGYIAFGLVQEQWLTFFYIGALVLILAKWPQWTARLRPIGQAGRMALTNYVLQGVVIDALASGYGAGLRLTPPVYTVCAFALFGIQVALSVTWLSRFRFGPMEWLWRMITYGRAVPIRRTAES